MGWGLVGGVVRARGVLGCWGVGGCAKGRGSVGGATGGCLRVGGVWGEGRFCVEARCRGDLVGGEGL